MEKEDIPLLYDEKGEFRMLGGYIHAPNDFWDTPVGFLVGETDVAEYYEIYGERLAELVEEYKSPRTARNIYPVQMQERKYTFGHEYICIYDTDEQSGLVAVNMIFNPSKGKLYTTRGDVTSNFFCSYSNLFPNEVITDVDFGEVHIVALKEDGTAKAVMPEMQMDHKRRYTNKEIKKAYDLLSKMEAGQTDVDEWSDIIDVAAGAYHTIGLKSDGTVVAAGKNKKGQCEVSDWENIVAVEASNDFTVGLKADGTVVATGDNSVGNCDFDGWVGIKEIKIQEGITVGLDTKGSLFINGASYDSYMDETNKWIGKNVGEDIVSFDFAENAYQKDDILSYSLVAIYEAGDVLFVDFGSDTDEKMTEAEDIDNFFKSRNMMSPYDSWYEEFGDGNWFLDAPIQPDFDIKAEDKWDREEFYVWSDFAEDLPIEIPEFRNGLFTHASKSYENNTAVMVFEYVSEEDYNDFCAQAGNYGLMEKGILRSSSDENELGKVFETDDYEVWVSFGTNVHFQGLSPDYKHMSIRISPKT